MEDFETLSEKLARVTNECERLREENSRLRELLNRQTPRSMKSLVAAEQGRPKPTQASPEAIPIRTEPAAPELSVAAARRPLLAESPQQSVPKDRSRIFVVEG
ncbi:MAG TPA: hypothetical protein VG897_16390 [Terriglobales bacterium]|nr:hypothetical protein [Terriglobales bacterium]